MSKINFHDFYQNYFLVNQHRIKSLILFNPFTIDFVLKPHSSNDFVRLETLILDNINTTNIDRIFFELRFLPYLQSLVFKPINHMNNPTDILYQISCLSKLKFCKINFKIVDDNKPLIINLKKCSKNDIKNLIINGNLSYSSIFNICHYFVELKP